jgi:serine/threonine protein kinase
MGGMGAVYLAQQNHPMSRFVAIKLIQENLETRQMLQRFQREQQTLADMDHVNIARIFDAGVTESGFHYIAMEHVQGEQILDYCNKHNPSIKTKVNLLLQCCRAIQHAHQRGTIHRDIKPSNVMVTIVDGEPIVKVIDFGIAKAMSHETHRHSSLPADSAEFAKAALHETDALTGTPLFMSPEQFETRGKQVDTRSDIYSLGALFYNILSGSHYLDKSKLAGKSVAAIGEMIRSCPTQLPSQKSLRHAAELRGDLDAIVLKAMQPDPDLRYQSVEQLHEDLRCYLTDHPVSANLSYSLTNLRKFSRRHKALLIATSFALAGLLAGLLIAIRQERRAVKSEVIAKQQAYASDMLLTSMALGQNNYSLARNILERHRPSQLQDLNENSKTPLPRLDWRLLNSKLPVPTTTLANFPTKIYYGISLTRGNEIACGCKDSHLRIIDCSTGNVRLDIDTNQKEINGLALSPDQTLIASGGDDGTVKVWYTETGQVFGEFLASKTTVFQLGWSFDGKSIVTAGIEPDAVIWSFPEFQFIRRLDSSQESLECLNVGKHGEVVYGSEKGIVRIGSLNPSVSSDIQTLALSTSRAFSVNQCSTVVVSPSGKLIAIGLDNGYLILLKKIGTTYHAVERTRFKTTVSAIAFDQDESRLALGEDSGTVHLMKLPQHWPTQSRLRFSEFFMDQNADSVESPPRDMADFWKLVVRSEPTLAQETLPVDCDRIYLEFDKPLRNLLFADNYLREWVDEAGNTNSNWIEIPTSVAVKGEGIEIRFENRFDGWNAAEDLLLAGRLNTFPNHSKRVASILWNHDESMIYSVSEDGKINRIQTDFLGQSIVYKTNIIGILPFAEDRIAVVSSDQAPAILKWDRSQPSPSISQHFRQDFDAFAGIAPQDTKNLYVCGRKKNRDFQGIWSIYRWDLLADRGEKVTQFPATIQPQFILGAIDGNRFVLLYRNLENPQSSPETHFSLGCWDGSREDFIWGTDVIAEPMRYQQLSPQKRFISYAKEREIVLIEAQTGKICSLINLEDIPIMNMRFSMDDQYLAVATADNRILCFRTDNSQPVWTLQLPGSAASDILWSKDLQTIVCLSRDGFLRTFDVTLRQMTAEIFLSITDPISVRSSIDEDILYILGLAGTMLRVPCNAYSKESIDRTASR